MINICTFTLFMYFKIGQLQLLLVGCQFQIVSHHHLDIDSIHKFLLVKITSYTTMQLIKLVKTLAVSND